MSRRPSGSELFAWSLVGAGLGLVSGFVLGELLGSSKLRFPRRWGSVPRGKLVARREGPPAVASLARAALRHDDQLHDLALEAVGVRVGVVEIHGWVPSRSLRARAIRVVHALPGIEQVVDCILVHGEDDAPESTDDLTDQTA
ncbi:MAG TPA: BON domain-containing protein [Gemmatimonadales bacterium]|nr:BON domain-containing protein [Gemmatimonadales bacterium]